MGIFRSIHWTPAGVFAFQTRGDGGSWVSLATSIELDFCDSKTVWILLHVNIITDFSSPELKNSCYTNESWFLWALDFCGQPGLEHLLAALFITKYTRDNWNAWQAREWGTYLTAKAHYKWQCLSFWISIKYRPYKSASIQLLQYPIINHRNADLLLHLSNMFPN